MGLKSRYYLATDILVGETDNHTVLRSVVLVLVLNDKAATSEVVSPSLTTPAELDLETLEVGLVLDNFDKTLQNGKADVGQVCDMVRESTVI